MYTSEPLDDIDNTLEKVLDNLNEIDTDQANDSSKVKLKDLTVEADKLMQNLKFIKSVFDSTDGYTSDEEEDKTYDGIAKNLSVLITHLKGILDNVNTYKSMGKFDDIDEFSEKVKNEIESIEKSLEKHSNVLKQISWKAKLSHRNEELKDVQQDTEDIISDGHKLLKDFEHIKDEVSKNDEGNEELLETLSAHISKITTSLAEIEEHKNFLEGINETISEFSDMIEGRDNSNLKHIIKLLKKNKDIKESISKTSEVIYDLDAQIDELIPFRDEHITKHKKKYKAKKGDEVDELLGELLNNTNTDVEIKRTGEGKYMVGDKKISAKVVNGKLLVRTGGGYMTMEEYMKNFGEAQLKRNQRKAKRENKGKGKHSKRMKTIRYSGTTRVVGSADLIRSMK